VLMKREKNEKKSRRGIIRRARSYVMRYTTTLQTAGRFFTAPLLLSRPSRAGITFVPVIGARADRKLPVIDSY